MEREAQFEALAAEMRQCQRCLDAGFSITPGAIFAGSVAARILIAGQAPGIREAGSGPPFSGRAGRRLFQWLAQAGFDEAAFRKSQYITAITKCFPGKQGGTRGDRLPSAVERRLCAPFLEREIALVNPEIVVPVGCIATRVFLGVGSLVDQIGRSHRVNGRIVIPLPHPSGANLWLNRPEAQRMVTRALAELRQAAWET